MAQKDIGENRQVVRWAIAEGAIFKVLVKLGHPISKVTEYEIVIKE